MPSALSWYGAVHSQMELRFSLKTCSLVFLLERVMVCLSSRAGLSKRGLPFGMAPESSSRDWLFCSIRSAMNHAVRAVVQRARNMVVNSLTCSSSLMGVCYDRRLNQVMSARMAAMVGRPPSMVKLMRDS